MCKNKTVVEKNIAEHLDKKKKIRKDVENGMSFIKACEKQGLKVVNPLK